MAGPLIRRGIVDRQDALVHARQFGLAEFQERPAVGGDLPRNDHLQGDLDQGQVASRQRDHGARVFDRVDRVRAEHHDRLKAAAGADRELDVAQGDGPFLARAVVAELDHAVVGGGAARGLERGKPARPAPRPIDHQHAGGRSRDGWRGAGGGSAVGGRADPVPRPPPPIPRRPRPSVRLGLTGNRQTPTSPAAAGSESDRPPSALAGRNVVAAVDLGEGAPGGAGLGRAAGRR